MTLAELLAIIGGIKDLVDIYEALKAKGLKSGDMIPHEHLAAIAAARAAVAADPQGALYPGDLGPYAGQGG